MQYTPQGCVHASCRPFGSISASPVILQKNVTEAVKYIFVKSKIWKTLSPYAKYTRLQCLGRVQNFNPVW